MLATITASSQILKIIIVGYLDTTTHELFDAELSALPISPTIEFEIHPPYYASMITSLPRLMSKNMVRCLYVCGRHLTSRNLASLRQGKARMVQRRFFSERHSVNVLINVVAPYWHAHLPSLDDQLNSAQYFTSLISKPGSSVSA
jgi:hypothetical protein